MLKNLVSTLKLVSTLSQPCLNLETCLNLVLTLSQPCLNLEISDRSNLKSPDFLIFDFFAKNATLFQANQIFRERNGFMSILKKWLKEPLNFFIRVRLSPRWIMMIKFRLYLSCNFRKYFCWFTKKNCTLFSVTLQSEVKLYFYCNIWSESFLFEWRYDRFIIKVKILIGKRNLKHLKLLEMLPIKTILLKLKLVAATKYLTSMSLICLIESITFAKI